MDAKITPEQAIDVIEYAIAILVHADCTARDIMNLQHTIELIKALAPEAELGRAAVKAKQDKVLCAGCDCKEFCRVLNEHDRLQRKGAE
ncbi:hypothetical protein [Sporomusa sphaeroides]|uniref:Uncharacterized protein n=1 Tax=Sporomusa sphaeroides DSM 2875 TaxID=1337886 RepID=A0ABP2C4L8_9FIRM|nr:hypothetical protein [Sporomusa sphaeroides]OLS56388.1 hypothetical protein SPSPH_27810 [Sporomusa sphaeroides DSM 2875]CVK18483.1 hypothetical protein SSPH_01121 [Sporomusa sphaeroides DSM 2875]